MTTDYVEPNSVARLAQGDMPNSELNFTYVRDSDSANFWLRVTVSWQITNGTLNIFLEGKASFRRPHLS